MTRVAYRTICMIAGALCLAPQAPAQQQIAKLLPADGGQDQLFGVRAAIRDGLTIVGTAHWGSDTDPVRAAYIFDSAGVQLHKLTPDGPFDDDGFGMEVAIGDGVALVAAPSDGSGAVHVFDVITGDRLTKWQPSDGGPSDRFGSSLAIADGLAIIGAMFSHAAGFETGCAYVIDIASGAQLWKLLPAEGRAYDHFGCAVGAEGSVAIIGAMGDDSAGPAAGSAYLFDITTGEQLTKLLASDAGGGRLLRHCGRHRRRSGGRRHREPRLQRE